MQATRKNECKRCGRSLRMSTRCSCGFDSVLNSPEYTGTAIAPIDIPVPGETSYSGHGGPFSGGGASGSWDSGSSSSDSCSSDSGSSDSGGSCGGGGE